MQLLIIAVNQILSEEIPLLHAFSQVRISFPAQSDCSCIISILDADRSENAHPGSMGKGAIIGGYFVVLLAQACRLMQECTGTTDANADATFNSTDSSQRNEPSSTEKERDTLQLERNVASTEWHE